MQRYFTDEKFVEDVIHLSGEAYKHIVRVMRMTEGDSIIVVTAEGAYEATISNISDDEVSVKRHGEALPSNELPVQITIVNGLAKGDKHDLIAQKATELGVSSMIPFKAERSVVKWDDKKGKKRIERLQKIAQQAAEQCHRTVIPTVYEPMTLKQLLIESKQYDVCFYADEEAAKLQNRPRLLNSVKKLSENDKVLVLFGPEGGLSRKEADAFLENGFLPIALGPRILRTETAPLYFLSAISYVFE